MSVLQANLRPRVNCFSIIDQNNKINSLLHFHSCFSFDFYIQPLWFPIKIVPVSAWISEGVLYFENQSPSCFHFNAKIIMCLKYRHNNVSKAGLDYQENNTVYLCCRSYLKNANWTWKFQWLSKFPQNVNYCYCYQKRQQRHLSIMTSKCSKWNNALG